MLPTASSLTSDVELRDVQLSFTYVFGRKPEVVTLPNHQVTSTIDYSPFTIHAS